MKKSLQKFIIYFIIGFILCFIFYFLIKRYDFNWNTLNRIISNKYYLIFLFLSIIICLSIYWKSDSKTKFLTYFIVCINCLYLLFLFLIWNIWLNNIQWLVILWFLILGFCGIYIKNWFWYIIIWLSLLWSLIILFLSIIPLYNEWPNFKWFEKSFNEKLLIYSNIDINEDSAQIIKDNKKYNILAWLNSYDLKLQNTNSQIIFKSDNLYNNTYCFIVFKWWDFIEILPQSAININNNFQIEILTWDIKYYPNNQKNFSFIWNIQWNLENSDDIINIVKNWYNENLKFYVKSQLWSEVFENKTVLKISKKTLEILSKIFPWKYEKNLKNLQDYLDILGINLNENRNFEKEINIQWVLNNFLWWLKKWTQMVD
jgi:hypothetical protein